MITVRVSYTGEGGTASVEFLCQVTTIPELGLMSGGRVASTCLAVRSAALGVVCLAWIELLRFPAFRMRFPLLVHVDHGSVRYLVLGGSQGRSLGVAFTGIECGVRPAVSFGDATAGTVTFVGYRRGCVFFNQRGVVCDLMLAALDLMSLPASDSLANSCVCS